MKIIYIFFPISLFLSSCSQLLPDVASIVHDVEDTAIVVEINRDGMQKETNVHIVVDVVNKDETPAPYKKSE